MPLSSSTSALTRRTTRCTAEPSRASSFRSRRNSLSRKPERIMDQAESSRLRLARSFSEFPQSWGIYHLPKSVAYGSMLDIRLCELTVLQVGPQAHSPYQWSPHVNVDLGVTEAGSQALINDSASK